MTLYDGAEDELVYGEAARNAQPEKDVGMVGPPSPGCLVLTIPTGPVDPTPVEIA